MSRRTEARLRHQNAVLRERAALLRGAVVALQGTDCGLCVYCARAVPVVESRDHVLSCPARKESAKAELAHLAPLMGAALEYARVALDNEDEHEAVEALKDAAFGFAQEVER